MSKLIVIEGPDRCGKATQSNSLCDYINKDLGKKALLVEVPIHDNFTYHVIYWMLRNGLAKRLPRTFQWIQCLNRWIFQSFDLVKLEHEYDYIVFDRWSPSTSVYGTAEGLPQHFIEKMYKFLRKPDVVIILHGKSHRHEAEDVYEKDKVLQRKVREFYKSWAKDHENYTFLISCEDSIESISREIRVLLSTMNYIPTPNGEKHNEL